MARPAFTISAKAIDLYQRSIANFAKLGIQRETAVRSAFQVLLDDTARLRGWKLVPEYPVSRRDRYPVRVDGALLDEFNLWHGLWEAKDGADDLDKEIKAKFALGYPRRNILFQSPDRAVLYQNGKRVLDSEVSTSQQVTDVLRAFLDYEEPAWEEWHRSSTEFKDRIAEHGRALAGLLNAELGKNAEFRVAFGDFVTLCRASINPTLSEAAVEEMLVQHLLTWRIFKGVFGIGDFMQKNVIAREIEKVILTIRAFSREEFLKTLNPFYGALENAAETITDFSEKQKFLNTVYERFFQGFAVRQADTLGIVYTPQPIVDFMVASVDHLVRSDFGKKDGVGSPGVHVLDGFTGTGNFIVNLMRAIPRSTLQQKYAEELHCNEVMLLPYYIASMNIEHEYLEGMGVYEPFEGICLVDTFQIADEHTGEGRIQTGFEFFSAANTERIKKQRNTPIFVCLGNPPYNAGQLNENDNNKNRKYPELDARVSATYGTASRATLLRKLADPYVKAIRWATDRIGDAGVVAFVNNNSFIDEISFDGMRHHLVRDFDLLYILDLGGNVRKNPKLSGTTHNVFGIQVGVSINFFLRLPGRPKGGRRKAKIFYHAVRVDWRKEQKYDFLESAKTIAGIEWEELTPDARNTWLTGDTDEEFAELIAIGSKEAKENPGAELPIIFRTYSLGVATNRDDWVFDFDFEALSKKVARLIKNFNAEVSRYQDEGGPDDLDSFVNNDPTFIKWTDRLKDALRNREKLKFDSGKIRQSQYRPFTREFLYFDRLLNQRRYQQPYFFPTTDTETENRLIITPGPGNRQAFGCCVSDRIPSLDFAFEKAQCFPFYTYDEDGTNRRENIPLTALMRFRSHYGDDRITKWDIFHYVYAILHHPSYRERFAANLKRELPRIPFAPDFRAFAKAGKRLAELHVGYEGADEFSLKRVENRDVPFSLRVEKMKFTQEKLELIYNKSLILAEIPPEVYDYKIGNRSALEWVIDQYRISPDGQSDPNRPGDEGYIVRLIGQVITVSLETLAIVQSLPSDFGAADAEPTPNKELRAWRMSQTHWMNSDDARHQREELKKSLVMQEAPPISKAKEKSSSLGQKKRNSASKRKNG